MVFIIRSFIDQIVRISIFLEIFYIGHLFLKNSYVKGGDRDSTLKDVEGSGGMVEGMTVTVLQPHASTQKGL